MRTYEEITGNYGGIKGNYGVDRGSNFQTMHTLFSLFFGTLLDLPF